MVSICIVYSKVKPFVNAMKIASPVWWTVLISMEPVLGMAALGNETLPQQKVTKAMSEEPNTAAALNSQNGGSDDDTSVSQIVVVTEKLNEILEGGIDQEAVEETEC